jgi:hypothetical protein
VGTDPGVEEAEPGVEEAEPSDEEAVAVLVDHGGGRESGDERELGKGGNEGAGRRPLWGAGPRAGREVGFSGEFSPAD